MLETLVALAVISLAGAAVFSAVSGEFRALERGRGSYLSSSVALRFDDALRDAVAKVRIPFWDRSVKPSLSEGLIVCPYVGGTRGAVLRIAYSADGATIDIGQGPRRFEGIERLSAKAITGPGGIIAGLSVSFRAGGVDYVTTQGFGAAALGEKK